MWSIKTSSCYNHLFTRNITMSFLMSAFRKLRTRSRAGNDKYLASIILATFSHCGCRSKIYPHYYLADNLWQLLKSKKQEWTKLQHMSYSTKIESLLIYHQHACRCLEYLLILCTKTKYTMMFHQYSHNYSKIMYLHHNIWTKQDHKSPSALQK